ncbi:DUF4174 domain-containing protein [Sunxiuqinia dokdonensis]|uniref:DUF4174 domain-containing protein n=1 Tax=Sunxiuqinia dokdonensis TaxID=1409788 RepID=A0A0L8V782_9BACT|nr:DUF4174 domain-containing protein [Sunxiuqinia dokdonensis]KOH44067.1 hypothetical protein NC99_30600 [Sunxiuqinia dokdonensis]
MNYLKILLFVALLFSVRFGSAQDLSKHQWENRLVLLLSDHENNTTFQAQLEEFRKDLTGLDERKLIVYQVMPGAYRIGLDDGDAKKSARL